MILQIYLSAVGERGGGGGGGLAYVGRGSLQVGCLGQSSSLFLFCQYFCTTDFTLLNGFHTLLFGVFQLGDLLGDCSWVAFSPLVELFPFGLQQLIFAAGRILLSTPAGFVMVHL